MRTAVDVIGLVAYLSLMYGRIPDRELIGAALLGSSPRLDPPWPPEARPRGPGFAVVDIDPPATVVEVEGIDAVA